jgi:hypothetical protein
MLSRLETKILKEQGRQGCKVSSTNHSSSDSPSAALTVSVYLENKDQLIILNDRPLQPAVKEGEGGQREEETDIEEPYDGFEIVEQSALDHFNAILQKAQQLAAEAERMKPRKRPRRYEGKSKRTLKRHKKCREDLAKQGYLSVFDFMAHVKESAEKRAHLEQLVSRASESKQVSEESASEELDTITLVSKHVGQVRRRDLLMHRD